MICVQPLMIHWFCVACLNMRILLSTLLLVLSCFVLAQSSKEDSLLAVLKTSTKEAVTFRVYKQLGDLNSDTRTAPAIYYYRKATSFPFRTEYSSDFVACLQSLGTLYQTLGRYDSSILLFQQAITLAQQFHVPKEIGRAYQGLGTSFWRLARFDTAHYYFNQMLLQALEQKDINLQGDALNNLGNMLADEGKYAEASEKYIASVNCFEKIKNEDSMGRVLGNLGNVQNIIGQYDKALDYTARSLAIADKLGNQRNSAFCHQLRGRIYRKLKDREKALAEYQQALKIYVQTKENLRQSETLNSIGNIYFEQEKFEEAKVKYEQAYRIARKINHLSILAFSYSSLGQVWYKLKNPMLAMRYLDSSIVMGRLIKNRYLVLDAYDMKSQIYADQNNFKEAWLLQQKFSSLKDSLNEESNLSTAQELEAKYQNEKKQNEITLLHRDKLLHEAAIRQSRTLDVALGVFVVLALVIGLLIFNRQKMMGHAKRQMEIEKIRNQIARDLHDDMGSTLSSINIFSQLGEKDERNPTLAKYFQRIGEHSSKMMENMADMVWAINPDNDTFQKTVTRMKEFSSEILEPKNISYQFDVEPSLHSISLHSAKRKNLFLIFKEAINNAAKYSEGNFIRIVFERSEDSLVLSILDNGKGFDSAHHQAGNGLGNMKERAAGMGGAINITATPGKGVSIQVRVAIT